MRWTCGTAGPPTVRSSGRCCRRLPRGGGFGEKGTSGRLIRQPDNSRQHAPQSQATVEAAGGTSAPPAGPSGVCAASAARPGRSRDSVQAVVLPGRHRRPTISPMMQLGGLVACPSLSPWRTYHDEPSCLTARPVEPRALAELPTALPTDRLVARLMGRRPQFGLFKSRARNHRNRLASPSRWMSSDCRTSSPLSPGSGDPIAWELGWEWTWESPGKMGIGLGFRRADTRSS